MEMQSNKGHCPDCFSGLSLTRDDKTARSANPRIQDYLLTGACNNDQCRSRGVTVYGCICCLECPSNYAKNRSSKTLGVIKVWGRISNHCSLAGHKESVGLWKQKMATPTEPTSPSQLEDYSSLPMDEDEPMDDPATPSSPKEEDWILHLGREVGRPVKSVDDILSTGAFHEKSNSPNFFWHELQHPGMGARHLTAKAFGIGNIEDVTDQEARFALLISSFLVQLTETQMELFAEILRYAVNYNDKEKSIFKLTRVPVSTSDFSNLYLKETSPTALIPNLPHPIPRKTPDGNTAFICLFETLANALGKGTPFDHLHFEADFVFKADDEPSVSQTPAAYTLLCELQKGVKADEFVLYLWIKRWRDDFDPNGTKQSRNQVWIHTLTCGAPANENTGRNTYFMAISAKGEDHSEVERIYVDQMNILATEGKHFYHGGLGRIIKVKAGLLSDCVDRPERTGMLRVCDHNGTFSTFWGHACHVDGECQENHLPHCKECRRNQLKTQLQAMEEHIQQIDVAPSELGGDNMLTLVVSPNCPRNKCSCWDVMKDSFRSQAPKYYPETCDERTGAPGPPLGREIVCQETNMASTSGPMRVEDAQKRRRVTTGASGSTRLPTIKLSADWLTQAVLFAHHNMKSHPPNTHRNKRYWKKSMMSAYLRTCGLTTRYIDSVYDSAKGGNDDPPIPATWRQPEAMERQHYGAMHLLGLGHIKSNFEMLSKMMSHFEIKATFGTQANIYLKEVQSLHCTRFFPAHPLSTSSWGTGAWVSENYFFFGRAIKFFFLLPAFQQERVINKHATYKDDIAILLRFVTATQAAFSRLMSKKRVEPDMQRVVSIYLDCMVEMDRWLLRIPEEEDNPEGEEPAPTGAANTESSLPGSSIVTSGNASSLSQRRKKNPNFVKSNSLGMLDATKSHLYFGPAQVNFEGGWTGEKKVQPIRPLMSLKRSNADWESISLRRIQQQETIQWLLGSLAIEKANKRSREMDGVLHYFKNKDVLRNHVAKSRVMVGVLDKHNTIWVPYRPLSKDYPKETSDRVITRASIDIVALDLDDTRGESHGGMCWMSPIAITDRIQCFDNAFSLRDSLICQYVLMLPKMAENGKAFCNLYYCIGHHWTERKSNGTFAVADIDRQPFMSWLSESDSPNAVDATVASM